MKVVVIKSASAGVRLVAEDNVLQKVLSDEFLQAYIPSMKVICDKNDLADATIYIQDAEENKIELDYPNVYLNCKNVNSKDVISLVEYVLERARQEKGIICVHGAGAVVKDKLVVTWGPATGMGKTSLALALADNGNYFYSDEKVLIDLKKFKSVGCLQKQYISNKFWKEKLGDGKYFSPDHLAEKKDYPIAFFIYGLICNQKECIIDDWSPDKFFWHLYEESARKIRGTSRTFFGFSYPVMSLDTEELAVKRLNLIKDFVQNISSIYYKGNLENIQNLIKERIKDI